MIVIFFGRIRPFLIILQLFSIWKKIARFARNFCEYWTDDFRHHVEHVLHVRFVRFSLDPWTAFWFRTADDRVGNAQQGILEIDLEKHDYETTIQSLTLTSVAIVRRWIDGSTHEERDFPFLLQIYPNNLPQRATHWLPTLTACLRTDTLSEIVLV